MAKKRELKDQDTYYLEFGIDIHGRKIFLDDDIDDVSVGWIIRGIQKMIEYDKEKPLDVYINSYGGEILSGLAVYDVLEGLDCIVRTHALGKVCSMGLIIYLAGDERYSSKRARFLHHEASTLLEGTLTNIKEDLKETNIVEDMCNKIVEEKTGKSNKWWQTKILKKDYWLGFEEARKLNIITHE